MSMISFSSFDKSLIEQHAIDKIKQLEKENAVLKINKDFWEAVADRYEKENADLKQKSEIEEDTILKLDSMVINLKQRLEKLQEENYEYENQLKETKYLDKKEVENVGYWDDVLNEYADEADISKLINAICKLAIKPVDKVITNKKIIERAEEWVASMSNEELAKKIESEEEQ